jgi:hypothetical protein
MEQGPEGSGIDTTRRNSGRLSEASNQLSEKIRNKFKSGSSCESIPGETMIKFPAIPRRLKAVLQWLKLWSD